MTRRGALFSTFSLAVAGAMIGLFVVACGIRPSGVITGQEAPHGAISSLIVYLLDHDTLRAVARPLPPSPTRKPADGDSYVYTDPMQQALNALVQGPTASEAAGGLSSDVPTNAFIGVAGPESGHVYQVFVKTDKSQGLTKHAVDQIACTLITSVTNTGYQHSDDYQVQVFDGGRPWDKEGCPLPTP
jgi:hypothetical protein